MAPFFFLFILHSCNCFKKADNTILKMAANNVRLFLRRHPIARGMLAYSITWPTGNIIQQTMDGKRWGNISYMNFIQKIFIHWLIHYLDTYDWAKCVQFSLYGSLYVAPTLYGWVKFTSKIMPVSNVRTAFMKTVLEQISYGPTATASFFFLISFMEGKSFEESKQEVCDKFWPTYKVSRIHFHIMIHVLTIYIVHSFIDGCVLLERCSNTKLFIYLRTKSSSNG